MTREDFKAWATAYCNRTGLNYPAGIDMVAAWWADLTRQKIDLATLREAGDLAVAQVTRATPERREQYRGILFHAIDFVIAKRAGGTPGVCRTRELVERNRPGADFTTNAERQAYWRKLRAEHGC